jgi:hypothetical protein
MAERNGKRGGDCIHLNGICALHIDAPHGHKRQVETKLIDELLFFFISIRVKGMCDVQASYVQASDIQATGLNGRHSGQCQGTFRPVKKIC